MPDLQQPQPGSTGLWSLAALDDADYALGCECAYPSLQIERWVEVRPPAPELS